MRNALLSFLFLSLSALLPGPGFAAGPEGGYEVIEPAQPTTTGDQVEVLEIFWYGCPHCFRFHPHVENWKSAKPEHAAFRLMPAIFRANWEPHARAYFIAEILDIVEQVHGPLFDAIHVENRKLNDQKSLAAFFTRFGVSEEQFIKTWDSYAVSSMLRRARVMTRRYKIRGVPTIIVNGRYRVSGSSAGSFENMIKVVNKLVAKESTRMRKAK